MYYTLIYLIFFIFFKGNFQFMKLEKYLSGLKGMKSRPDIVILVGQNHEMNAVKECLKLQIPIITILDTNCDPDMTDFAVPANDDSVGSVSLILNAFSKAINIV